MNSLSLSSRYILITVVAAILILLAVPTFCSAKAQATALSNQVVEVAKDL